MSNKKLTEAELAAVSGSLIIQFTRILEDIRGSVTGNTYHSREAIDQMWKDRADISSAHEKLIGRKLQ